MYIASYTILLLDIMMCIYSAYHVCSIFVSRYIVTIVLHYVYAASC